MTERPGLLISVFAVIAIAVAVPSDGAPVHAEESPTFRLSRAQGWDVYNTDVKDIGDALGAGSNWGNIPPHIGAGVLTIAEFKQAVQGDLAGAKPSDVSIFIFFGHGAAQNDADPVDEEGTLVADTVPKSNCDTTPCDEGVLLDNRADRRIWDDGLSDIFAGLNGTKILIFDSCLSGGLVDGTSDLRPSQDRIIVTAAGSNEKAKNHPDVIGGEPHSYFTGFLAAGLGNDGAGNARADKSAVKGTVTLGEWFDYAKDRTVRLSKNGTIPNNGLFTPLRFPATGNEDLPILVYEPGKLTTVTEDVVNPDAPYTGRTSAKGKCGCESSDCPASEAVGGEAGLLDDSSARAEAADDSGGAPLAPIAAAVAAGVAALAGGWYLRKSWRSRRT